MLCTGNFKFSGFVHVKIYFTEKHLQDEVKPENKNATLKNEHNESDKEEEEEDPEKSDPPSPMKKKSLDTCQ